MVKYISSRPHGASEKKKKKKKNTIQYNLVKPPPSVQPDFGVITSLAIK